MKLAVVSPEGIEAREAAVLEGLFAAGLERYHVRKPAASAAELECWLLALPAAWRPRLVLHQHHELVGRLGLGGRHWRDDGTAPEDFAGWGLPSPPESRIGLTSRSCHDLPGLRAALGRTDVVLFGPVFRSISKAAHGPGAWNRDQLRQLLAGRTERERRTAVCALGGVTSANLGEVSALGFDGAAVLGSVWRAADPVAAFGKLQQAAMKFLP